MAEINPDLTGTIQPWQCFSGMFVFFWAISAYFDHLLMTMVFCIAFGVLAEIYVKKFIHEEDFERERSSPEAEKYREVLKMLEEEKSRQEKELQEIIKAQENLEREALTTLNDPISIEAAEVVNICQNGVEDDQEDSVLTPEVPARTQIDINEMVINGREVEEDAPPLPSRNNSSFMPQQFAAEVTEDDFNDDQFIDDDEDEDECPPPIPGRDYTHDQNQNEEPPIDNETQELQDDSPPPPIPSRDYIEAPGKFSHDETLEVQEDETELRNNNQDTLIEEYPLIQSDENMDNFNKNFQVNSQADVALLGGIIDDTDDQNDDIDDVPEITDAPPQSSVASRDYFSREIDDNEFKNIGEINENLIDEEIEGIHYNEEIDNQNNIDDIELERNLKNLEIENKIFAETTLDNGNFQNDNLFMIKNPHKPLDCHEEQDVENEETSLKDTETFSNINNYKFVGSSEESDANDVYDANDMNAVIDINGESGSEKLEESISETQSDAHLNDSKLLETNNIKEVLNSCQDEQIHVKNDDNNQSAAGETVNKTESIDIDLTDPAVEAAATKIQSLFKGYKTRKKMSNL